MAPIPAQAAPFWRQVLHHTRFELLLIARRGENIMATLLIPALAMIVSQWLNLGGSISFTLPGILAIAMIAAGMVNLGIATAYERYYGVLKRLGSSPFSRLALLSAKILSILALEVVQIALLLAIAFFAYGWRPEGSLLIVIPAILLGTTCFSAMGLWMAGSFRAELTLVLANLLFLVFLFISGGMVPLSRLPEGLVALSRLTPATALTEVMQASFQTGAAFPGIPFLILGLWALAFIVLASRYFRWE